MPSVVMAQAYRVSSGTGFFVSKNGDIVTNAHVVNGCDTVEVRGAVAHSEAKVIAVDEEIDLALLRSGAIPKEVAALREGGDPLGKSDPVVLIGYPEERGVSGEYEVTISQIVDVHGPLGHDQWLQFADAAKRGNSGGPLLDAGGNVVGVITGKSTISRINPIDGKEEIISNADVAITLERLQKFLDGYDIYYAKNPATNPVDTQVIEVAAKDYIVNIHCRI